MSYQNRWPTESDIPMHGWGPYSEMHRERIRAHNKHKARDGSMEEKDWDHPIWLAVLTEELGEVARVLCDSELGLHDDARLKLREELIQVGAMTAAWVDALDARLIELPEIRQESSLHEAGCPRADPSIFVDPPCECRRSLVAGETP